MITNATVAGITAAAQGHVLKVTYKGGEAEVIVAPDTPIVTYVAGDATLLKPGGAAIFVYCEEGRQSNSDAGHRRQRRC
jgi:hypothetical protein